MQVEHHHPMVALLDRLSGPALGDSPQHPADGASRKRPQKFPACVAMSLSLASVTGMHGASLLKIPESRHREDCITHH
jgi:hypothetical protein